MPEFFIVAYSHPAPFFGDTIEWYVEATTARQALELFQATYFAHPAGMHSARVWASADDYHKNAQPLAEVAALPPKKEKA